MIRPAKKNDENNIRNLYYSTVVWMSENKLKQWRYRDIDFLFKTFKIEDFFIYELKNELIGFIIASAENLFSIASNSSLYRTLFLYKLTVDRKYTKKGYSEELLNYTKVYGVKKGYHQLCLTCLKENKKLLDFYSRNKFIYQYETAFTGKNKTSVVFTYNLVDERIRQNERIF